MDAYRHRSCFVGSLGFARLPAYFPARLLASVRVVEVADVPIPPLTALGLPELADFEGITPNGITFPDTLFVKGSHARDESLFFHELVHAVQWQYLGPEKFLLAYAIGLLQGYHTNPVEIMAYDLQTDFDRGRPAFDAAAEVVRRLDTFIPSMLERAA